MSLPFVLVGFGRSLSFVPSFALVGRRCKQLAPLLRPDDQIARAVARAIWSQGKHLWWFKMIKHVFRAGVLCPKASAGSVIVAL